jgi:hypothetical protein
MARAKHGPEWFIRRDLKEFLESRGWHVEILVGSAFQTGIPDLYCFKRGWGERWIDVKQPKRYSFTKAQKLKWPVWERAGIGIWILVAATQVEYDKLFGPPNWRSYVKKSWKLPTAEEIDLLMEKMEDWRDVD